MSNLATTSNQKTKLRQFSSTMKHSALACIIAAGLSACASTKESDDISLAWQDCVSSAMQQQARADSGVNPGLYLDAARRLDMCTAEQPLTLNPVQKKQAYKVAVLKVTNYAKAGDLKSAAKAFTQTQSQFPGADLILPDGSSFNTTMSLLTGQTEVNSSAQLTLLNAPSLLKRELQQL